MSALFGRAAMRLLREGWTGARQLAEELFAIFASTDIPINTNGGITSGSNDPGFAPLTAEIPSDGGLVLNIKRKNLPDLPLSVGPDGGLNFDGEPVGSKAKQTAAATATTGTVKSGTGSRYLVTVPAGNVVTATAVGVAAGETVPAGTAVILQKISGVYFFQVAVWM